MKPCSKCGGTDRNASGGCRPCQAARSAKWAAANSEQEKARKAAVYQANREKIIARSTARFQAKREEISIYKAAWNRANRDKHRAYSSRWRAKHPEQRSHFNAAGELLYVGISLSAIARLAEHRSASHWFWTIARIEVAAYASRASAEKAERITIQREKPLHNITHARKSA